jgi:peptidoglycan/xylan/chitin deacetylase (PgdA/CDA1 family)
MKMRLAAAAVVCGFVLLMPVPAGAVNVLRGDRGSRNFYLTLDAHNDPRGLPEVLEVLRRHQVRATFFMTGYFLENFPESARAIKRQGHLAANHTWTHSRCYSAAVLRAELERTEQLYWRVTGTLMEKLWRAPYLQHVGRGWLVAAMYRQGYTHVDVTLGARDWVRVFDPGYLDNIRFLQAFRAGLDFRRFARMIVCGRSLAMVRAREPAYQGVIMLYHLGRFRPEGFDFIYSMEQVIVFLKRSGYRFRDCRDFLPGNGMQKPRRA